MSRPAQTWPIVSGPKSLPLNVPYSVVMANFESPTKFWLRLADSKLPYIKDFVNGVNRHLYTVQLGQYCVADTRTLAGLARACVTDVHRNAAGWDVSAKVYCLDHGLTLVLSLDRLYSLLAKDARTPCVAIPCCLHGVATCTRPPPPWRPSENAELEAVFVGVSGTGVFQTKLFVLRYKEGTVAKCDAAEDFTLAKEAAAKIRYLQSR
ncbi:uncharacterized protein LOC144124916 [Amblyomma americanum]